METNGSPFKIHVSGSTADLIRSAGKGYVFEHIVSFLIIMCLPHDSCFDVNVKLLANC